MLTQECFKVLKYRLCINFHFLPQFFLRWHMFNFSFNVTCKSSYSSWHFHQVKFLLVVTVTVSYILTTSDYNTLQYFYSLSEYMNYLWWNNLNSFCAGFPFFLDKVFVTLVKIIRLCWYCKYMHLIAVI